MGSSNWDVNSYINRSSTRAATGSSFAYSSSISSGTTAAKVHDKMNPKGVIRECRDSDAHPETLPIMVFFDVTGSMGNIPRVLQKKLGQLMETLIGNGYVDHPQILFGAVGDSYSDRAPLQAGQFENGIELDDDLERIWLEGNGGGQASESYALPWYFAAKHTVTDAWEKRGKKGYLFTMGDEMTHDLTRNELHELLGDSVQSNVSAEEAVQLALEKYEIFHIVIGGGSSHGHEPRILEYWRSLLGERALFLDNPEAVCETIASTIGILEGRVGLLDIEKDLVKAGANYDSARSASRAVTAYAEKVGSLITKATSTGTLATNDIGDSGITHL